MMVKSPHFAIKLLKQRSQLSNRYLGFLESKTQVRGIQKIDMKTIQNSRYLLCCITDILIMIKLSTLHSSLESFCLN